MWQIVKVQKSNMRRRMARRLESEVKEVFDKWVLLCRVKLATSKLRARFV